MAKSRQSDTALILAGAVAKGAFEAGVLEVLARTGMRIKTVVGASAGSLNGALFAAGIRLGKERQAAAQLVDLWTERADWDDVFSASWGDLLAFRGASDMTKARALLRKAKAALPAGESRGVELRMVVTALAGAKGDIGADQATTFERVTRFNDADFDTEAGWEGICEAAVASASFPGAFVPAEVRGVGACLDGGIVNNTPVKWALEGAKVDRIIVVTAAPAVATAPEPLEGRNLLGHFVDILVNERLYRDLHRAEGVNDRLRRLDALVQSDVMTDEQREAVCDAFNWRPLEVVQIRPPVALSGHSFAGFFDGGLRSAYVDAGRDAAQKALAQLA